MLFVAVVLGWICWVCCLGGVSLCLLRFCGVCVNDLVDWCWVDAR